MATERVTKAGVYVEDSGASLQDTKTGVYVELQLPSVIEDQVTKAGVYVEITNTMDRVTQAGVYVELQPTERVTQAGTYVELRGTLQNTKMGVYVEISPPHPNPPTLARLADYTALLWSFDFLPIVNLPLTLRPIHWSWQDFGGSNEAEIAADGQLGSLINWLPELPRMPIAIVNPIGSKVWLGFVNTIELRIGDLILSVTLDGLANRVIVAYNELAEGDTASASTPAYTALAGDDYSMFRYGYFDLLYQYGEASTSQAEALRDRILAELSAIQSDTRLDNGQGVSARLLCKGWVHSAKWTIFDESSTTNATIADQVGQVVSALQFVNVIDTVDDNTIESNPYTDPIVAYDRLAALLEIADQDGDTRRAIFPEIGVFRYEKVYRDEDQFSYFDGQFSRANRYPLQPGESILGYCRDYSKRLIGNLANANRFYIVESEFDAESSTYTIRTKGTPSPWR